MDEFVDLRWPAGARRTALEGGAAHFHRADHFRHRYEPDTRLPLFRYPDCVKRYELQAERNGGWERVAGEEDNYMRRRVLRFPAITTAALRLVILETNGAAAARVYEVRVYA